jgi:8-amino-7-oxononanoate synthase
VQADDAGRHDLHTAAAAFRAALARRGVPTLGQHYIVPIVLGDDAIAARAARALQERGYDIRAIRPPSVPAGTARLRISIHADHDLAMFTGLAEALAEVAGGRS